MSLLLFDSVRHAKVEFVPRHPEEVRVYSYGPAESARRSLAALRPYVVVDVFKRRLRARGHRVRHVIPIQSAAETSMFQRDLALLGVEAPTAWVSPSLELAGKHSLIARTHLGEEIDVLTCSVEQHEARGAGERSPSGEAQAGHWLRTARVLSEARGNAAREELSIDELAEQRITPRAYRLLLLGTHYRHRLFLTWRDLQASAGAYRELAKQVARLCTSPALQTSAPSAPAARLRESFELALDDDLNTPRALGVLWTTLGDPRLLPAEKAALVREMDSVLGLDLADRGALFSAEWDQQRPAEANPVAVRTARGPGSLNAPRRFLTPPVLSIVEERTQARAARDFARADALRFELEQLGFILEDHRDGTRVRHCSVGEARRP